ncbi:MAG: LysR family transcriptional regulator [Pseudomonadota bacterium]
MDRFEEMRTFVTVVKQGSLSAAANKLDIANSAISRRLVDLEQRLGVQLLNRTTRRINITESGQQFYRYCQRILADLKEAEQLVSSEQAQLQGTIRLAAPLSFGIKHLAPVLDDFLKLHKSLNLEIDLNDRLLNLMDEEVDLAIRIGQLDDSSYKARRLAPVKRVICASPDYLEKNGTPKKIEDLKKHISLNYSNISESESWQFFAADGVKQSIQVPHRIRANNGDFLLKGAIDGLGIIATPSFISYEAIKQGKLIAILKDYKLPQIAIYAIYPEQRHLPKRVRLLIDYLVEKFGDSPYWDR